MATLEREIIDLRKAINSLPDSVEKEIAARAARHSYSLIDRQIDTAFDAYQRAKRFYAQAASVDGKRKSSVRGSL